MKRFLAVLLAVSMIVSVFPLTASATDDPTETSQSSASAVADADTRYTYQSIFDLNNTRYDGRIWTDKTVSTGDLTYTGNVRELGDDKQYHDNNQVVVKKCEGEDLLVSYSALASTTTVLSETDAPIDLVLVLDLSPMSNSVSGKLDSMLRAVESAAAHMMALNENNRVAIVAYSSQAVTLLPLGHYSSITMTRDDADPSQATAVTCTYEQGETTGNKTFHVSYQNRTPVNKYTQMGIYAGMKILAEEGNTSVSIGEGQTEVTRQPALILLSEGEPKIASTNISQPTLSTVQADGTIVTNGEEGLSTAFDMYNIFVDRVEIMRNNGLADSTGPEADDRHAQAFATLLTAAYMKKEVTKNYFKDRSESSMQVYTMGINTATANSPSLAQIVLDPSSYLAAGASNKFSDDFIGYADSYFDTSGSVTIQNAGEKDTVFDRDPSLGLTGIDDLKYNDGYYDVKGSGAVFDWDNVFDVVLSQVTQNTAKVPTLVDQTDVTGQESGWLSYTDPLGDYMEVKDVKALIIDDVIYRTPFKSNGTIKGAAATIYTFSGTANNPVYGSHDLKDINIYVTEANGRQEFHVDIPAALLPLRQTTVTENAKGQVIGYTHNNAYPFRLVYSVGLQAGVLDENGKVDLSAVSEDYLETHTQADGTVYFYEGQYSGNGQGEGTVGQDDKTIGDAFVTYTPALDNPFYYVEEDTPLYLSKSVNDPAKSPFDEDTTYYFQIDYYAAAEEGQHPAEKVTAWVERPGSTLRGYSLIEKEGQLYLEAGAPRLGNLADFRKEKVDQVKGSTNYTDTADIYLYLSYTGQTGEGNNHAFQVFHGNNGRLSAPLPDGTLTVNKTVVGDGHHTGEQDSWADQAFSFTISYTPADGTEEITESFTLKNNESKLFYVARGTRWTVTENAPTSIEGHDWTTQVQVTGAGIDLDHRDDPATVSGTMPEGGRVALNYTNTLNYTPTTGTLVVAKFVDGDTAQATAESFQFTLTGPVGTGGSQTASPADHNTQRSTELAPGTYTITETQPGPGWTASYIVTGSERIGGDRNEAPATGYEAEVEIEAGRTTAVTFTNHYTAPDPVPEDPDAVTLPGEALTVSKEYTGDVYDGEVSFTLTAGSYTALSDETVPEEPPANGSAVGSDTGDPGAATDPETPVVPDDPTSPNEPTVPGTPEPGAGAPDSGNEKEEAGSADDQLTAEGPAAEGASASAPPLRAALPVSDRTDSEPTDDMTDVPDDVMNDDTSHMPDGGTDSEQNTVPDAPSEELPVTVPMPEGSVNGEKTVTIHGTGSAQFGGIIFERPGIYTYTVTEDISASVTGGSMEWDASEYTVTVTVSDLDKDGTLEAVATYGKGTDSYDYDADYAMLFTNTFTPDPEPEPQPGLTVTKTADTGSIEVGETVTYTVTVANTGDVELHNVTITDTLWGQGVDTAVIGGTPVDVSSGSYTIGSLAINERVTIVYNYTADRDDEGGAISNTATAQAEDGTTDRDTQTVTVDEDETGNGDEPVIPPTPSTGTLRIQKTVSGTGADADGSFQFLITLSRTITGSYDGVWFDDGQAVVTIQAGQTLTITGLPYGVRYTVAELDSGDYTVTAENETGTIGTPNRIVRFHNHLDAPAENVPDDTPEDLNTEDHIAYLIGFPDGTIRPEEDITRAEVATIFFRLLTDEARTQYWSQTSPYPDVDSGDWYNNAVSTLTNMGIMEGKDDGAFHPLDAITKAEFATIAVRFFDYTAEYREGTFADVDGDVWYADYIQAASDVGLIEGDGTGNFEPMRYITRAEAATIVNRTLGRVPHEDHLLPRAEMITWPDNADMQAWYYEAMQEATNSHDYSWTAKAGERVEQWTGKLDERDWAALEREWSNANSAPGGEIMQ